MVASRTLLERLEHPDRSGQRRLGAHMGELKDSIRKTLQRLLNSSHDGSTALPDFGLQAFADLSVGGHGRKQLEKQIQQAIGKYEPRLTDVRVSFVSDSTDAFSVRFDIIATIRGGGTQKPTVFRSVVEPSGQIDVRR